MSRLVVVSNRVADLEQSVQSGGLAVALGDALKETHGLWFGWDGNIVEEGSELEPTTSQQGQVHIATVPLTRREYEQYYLGYSNKILWPTFHYRLDLAVFDPTFFEGYRNVNRRLAQSLARLLGPDDLVWIHDYHLIPLAAELRDLGVRHRIGFFLHIPFPPPDILLALPDHDWLARSLFSYDVVGFQTSIDAGNFVRYVVEHGGGKELDGNRVSAFGSTAVADVFPIGIDADSFRAMAHTAEADLQIARLQRRSMANTFVIGVDRLDYTKGLPERMKSFRRLLELFPENRKAVTLMQIAPPTREEVEAYADIRQELEGLSGAINGEFGDFDWTPVRYIHRAMPRPTLAALIRGSKVGLVTPLRDGMNLVAKEYIAGQDDDDPGVLVLSRFAGAAEDLVEALIVNPYDTEEVANAIQRALEMSRDERRERHQALMARVRQRDVASWRKAFLTTLGRSGGQEAA
ncbi:MAG: alpha,alpha-trehalose-phosphate synthase (UDP-forming) [Pseudomonadota bacterium]